MALHDKHGAIVRIGPNELSLNGADAVTDTKRTIFLRE